MRNNKRLRNIARVADGGESSTAVGSGTEQSDEVGKIFQVEAASERLRVYFYWIYLGRFLGKPVFAQF
jgi:hypothetical protein